MVIILLVTALVTAILTALGSHMLPDTIVIVSTPFDADLAVPTPSAVGDRLLAFELCESLYAIPIERWVELDVANAVNAWFLGAVAAWRVAGRTGPSSCTPSAAARWGPGYR